jgi:uncharacterized protein with FMN-binding domain
MAIGSAAVLSVYGAGFLRTNDAAQQLEQESDARRRPASAGASALDASRDVHADTGIAHTAIPNASLESTPAVATAAASATVSPTVVPGSASSPTVAAVPAKSQASESAAAAPAAANVNTTSAPASSAASSASTSPTTAPVAVVTRPAPPAATTTAPATPPVVSSSTPPADSTKAPAGWKDGSYTGWGTSRHGDIEATVVIEGGRITAASISRCLTRYSCSWIAHLQQQVVTRQSPDVDNVSGATQSANAFYYAVTEALQKAK